MSNSAASIETIRFLRTLTDDGQLSGEEVWCLANWLNENRDATTVWPGNILVAPLQDAFADGSLSLEEMTQLAVLLSQIERDWSSRPLAPVVKPSQRVKKEPATRQMLHLTFDSRGAPELPSLPVQTSVRSHSSDDTYQVDLTNHTCECGDWVGKQSRMPPRSIGRCCKHIAEALNKKLSPYCVPQWFAAILEDCCGRRRGVFPSDKWRIIQIKNALVAMSKGDSEWVNVFAPGEGGYERFGYNKSERRWSYGIGPKGQRAIAATIHESF